MIISPDNREVATSSSQRWSCTMYRTGINPLDSKGNYCATLNNTMLVHWPLILHLVQRGEAWVGCGPARPLLAVPNVTAHPSGIVGFNVPLDTI